MAVTLSWLKTKLNSLSTQISTKKAERQGYLNVASDIGKVYGRVRTDKMRMEGYRYDIKTMYKEKYELFKGDRYLHTYKPEMSALLDEYDALIKRMDSNLDALNNAMLEYDNKASACLGPLGVLEKTYNSVHTRIQNWTN